MPYKFLLFLLFLYNPLAIAKYQVCSITINSSSEIEVFKQFLSPDEFQFVELLPSKVNEEQDHSSHWFNTACEKNYKCDILVVSGHFGGTFFGESGYALPTEILEEKTCQNKCHGILSNVKEIFLFGCNTLASKKKDTRTYQDYLQVLLDDGMARETAERVVASRYSPLETPFYARMNFIFSGSNTIYGFDQLSPLGKHIRNPLKNYFQSINKNFGSYSKYLKTEKHKRPRNEDLFKALSHTTLSQAHISLSSEDVKQKQFFTNKCLLYDNTKKMTDRMEALKSIFEAKQSGSAFFAVDYFLNRNKKEVIEGKGRTIFRYIRQNKSFISEFLSYYKHLDFLPYIKIVYLNVLEKFQWIDPLELKALRKKDLLELIKIPDPESYISLLLLLKQKQIKPDEFYISKKELPEDYIQNLWSLLIFEKLKVEAPEWQPDILNYCKDHIEKTPALCYQALNTLAHIKPSLKTARSAVNFLNYGDDTLSYYTIRMLGQSKIENYSVHKKISYFLNHKDQALKQEALEVLGFLRTPYENVQNDIALLLPQANEELAKEIFWSFNRMDVKGDAAQKTIIQYIIKNFEDVELASRAFQSLKNTSQFSDFTLSFFYNQLDSRENLDFLLFIIENLSDNNKLKDLGIHYRFLQFQKEKSADIKIEILKRMTFLNWLHPEVQLSFLKYLEDENPEVRMLAINILRNINNLQDKTLNQIEILYEEENIEELKDFVSSL